MTIKTANILKSKKFEKPDQLCIFLHGYGTDGNDFCEAVEFFMPDYNMKNTVFLFPNGPFHCEVGEGYQWFSLKDISYEGLRAGLNMAGPMVSDYIESASKEYSCKNITLLGFSQGAIMCFELLYYLNISKLISFSGLFAVPKNKAIVSKQTKALIIHSEDDPVVPYRNAELAKENLDILSLSSEIMKCRGIGHSISKDGWEKSFSFIC